MFLKRMCCLNSLVLDFKLMFRGFPNGSFVLMYWECFTISLECDITFEILVNQELNHNHHLLINNGQERGLARIEARSFVSSVKCMHD